MPIGILVSAIDYLDTRLIKLIDDDLWRNRYWDAYTALPLLGVLLLIILFPLIFEKQAPSGEFEFLMSQKVFENVQNQAVGPEDVDLSEKEFSDIIGQEILERRKEIGPFLFNNLPNEHPNMYAYTRHELKAWKKLEVQEPIRHGAEEEKKNNDRSAFELEEEKEPTSGRESAV